RFHIAEYEEFVLASRQKDATTQQTLTEALQKRAKHPAESPKAKGITEKLLNFIILDDQPLSVVENVGFRSLMEHLEPSLLEQKRALCAYTADHNLPVTLSVNEWAILEKTVIVLEPFEELTRNISSATSTTADVIPAITVLKRLLSNESSTDSDIKTMKSTLLQAVDRRFSNIEGNPLYSVATLLAPRYKDRYFTNEDAVEHTKAALTQEMEKMEEMLHRAKESESLATGPEEKVPRIEAAGPSRIQSSLTSLYENILEEHEEPGSESAKRTVIQMQTYLKELTIPRSDNPFEYWGNNHARFPILAATAVKFLSAPSTSVESERLFSTASNIVDEKRNRLTAEKAEMLIFLKKNIPRFLK
ncbi:hypothetical protein NFI96_025157, partial [Prochilodus magdalenae]